MLVLARCQWILAKYRCEKLKKDRKPKEIKKSALIKNKVKPHIKFCDVRKLNQIKLIDFQNQDYTSENKVQNYQERKLPQVAVRNLDAS